MTTEQPDARVIGRIQKLLRLANDSAATEGERDNAMRMAHATLAKYNLDMATVEAAGGKAEAREEQTASFYGRPWARTVCGAAAKLLFCEYIITIPRGQPGHDIYHHFIGRTSNAVTARELAAYLVKSIIKEGNRRYGFGRSEWRNFCLGAALQVKRRVDELIAAATKVEKTPGTALVLANVYQIEAQQNALVVCEMYPKLGKASAGRKGISDALAFTAGAQYGQGLSLQRQVGDNGGARPTGRLPEKQ